MDSFRTEIENPVVAKDIIDLEQKIFAFKNNNIDEEKFRSLRLARGVYGQRQQGVQMVRIKIPYGKFSSKQLLRIADVADRYSNGNLHITTRQDVQIHHVDLEKTPQLWAELEQDDITLREACGNTVRNVTASPFAGIDPDEPFDVSPYAQAFFSYFLRNPICQDMGRKIKIAFSSSAHDYAYTFVHDIGFIPKIKDHQHGFKVVVGGGIGSQP
ncbi:MAG: nitrite reductase, partial [Flavobacteriaceae bacterium]